MFGCTYLLVGGTLAAQINRATLTRIIGFDAVVYLSIV